MKDTKVKVAAEGRSDSQNDLKWIKGIGWGIATGFAGVFIGLITWYLPKELENNRQLLRSDTAQQLGSMTQDLAVLKSQVASISAIIPELMKEKLKAKGAQLKESLNSVGSIAKKAREEKLETDSSALGEVGVQVLRIGDKNSDLSSAAWQATTELLNYRSFLNSKTTPDISGAIPITQSPVPVAIEFTGQPIPPYSGYPYPAIPVNMTIEYVGPIVPLESSALLEPLSFKPQDHPSQKAPKYYVVETKGLEFSLDGYRMRNVIFKGGTLSYDGGPAAIQNVYLVNCTFKFKPTPDWKRLSELLFARTPLDFSKPSS
jgi:hypothetical protein